MSSLFSLARIRSEPGAKLYFRQSGTSTPQNVYTDAALQVAHQNPVVADAEGVFAPIYLDPSLSDYRYILTDGSNEDDDYTLEVLLEPITDDYPASPNVSSTYRARGTNPTFYFEETDASSNNKKWRMRVNGETFSVDAGNDAESSWTPLLTLDRTHPVQVIPLVGSDAALNISSLSVGHSAFIAKTTDTTRTGTTAQALDPVLQFTNAPAGTYAVQGSIFFLSPSAADFAIAWPRIASASGLMSILGFDSLVAPVGSIAGLLMSSTVQVFDTTVNIIYCGNVNGVETATAGQTLGPTWAQSVSNGGNTKVLAGSWLRVTRLT